MDILILDSWLREHLKTDAGALDIAKCLTLCGPSIEKVDKIKNGNKNDYVYHIEVTTNRVDMMCVRGIAREASVILPEFGIRAELLDLQKDDEAIKTSEEIKLELKSDPKLVDRLMGVVLEVPMIEKSPDWLKTRLEASGIRSLNSVVDITNYIMTEVGQPTHVFDYDLVKPTIAVRESKKGESVTSFDGKTYKLPGGDIVFENEKHEIIDLPGIIGTINSVVNEKTKRILFFIDNNDPTRIRRTSMTLGIRTVAATLNEKSVDPEIAYEALKRGIFLYKKICHAKQISTIYDVYSNKPKVKNVVVKHEFIEKILGVKIDQNRVLRILNSLEIKSEYRTKTKDYVCTPPSFRAKDITIQEDIVEEIARIYGYHNLPSTLMSGTIPQTNYDSPFVFETNIRRILSGYGGSEIYTLSLIPISLIEDSPLKLKNPLGSDTEYLRTSLKNSLVAAVNENRGVDSKIHLFELANVYLPKKKNLPDEIMSLAGIFSKYQYREAKGVMEAFLGDLNINCSFVNKEISGFLPSKSASIIYKDKEIGIFGVLQNENIYYEFSVETLRGLYKEFPKFTPIPKFPAQIEDMTFTFPDKTLIGNVITTIKGIHQLVSRVELRDIYNDSFTFRIWYQSSEKTLQNQEIESIRKFIIENLQKKFGAKIK